MRSFCTTGYFGISGSSISGGAVHPCSALCGAQALSHWGGFLHCHGWAAPAARHSNHSNSSTHKPHPPQLLHQMIWRELDHIWHRQLWKTGVLLYQKKLTSSINDKRIFFLTSPGRQYQHKCFSKSSALALLWIVNKSKKWICLTQHVRWPCKTCLRCYKFANQLSTLLIKNCIFCWKSLSLCVQIYLYIPP